MTREQITEARYWLDVQRAVVHPGPIETIREALDIAEGSIAAREMRAQARERRVPFVDDGQGASE